MTKIFLLGAFLVGCLNSVRQSRELINVPQCSGSNDTTELVRIISDLGSRGGTLKLPSKRLTRCVSNNLTIPSNVTLDNTDGGGIRVNNGQTLTILGTVVSPLSSQIFFNALPGQGTISFKDNKYMSVLYPEWWGAKTTKDDAPALNACSAAAATLSAADIDLVNAYNLASTWQVGVGSPFTYITLRGHGAGSNGTTLNWVGAADGLMLKFWANKFSNIERIRFQNSGSFGRTVALRFSGPGTGTQSNNYNIDNCDFTGFYQGLQAGDPTTPAAVSEVSLRNVVFDGNANGFIGLSTGNTLNITFLNCSFLNNTISGLHLGSASDCHIFGGGFGANGTDITATNWTSTLSVIGVRFEMVNPDVALTIGGAGTVAVRNCTFMSEPNQVPTHAIIRGETSLTLENNLVGRPGESWIFYDYGTGGSGNNYQFVATSNIVRGKLMYVWPDNSAIDGLTTIIEGVKGEVVWPNLVPDALAGQGQLSGGTLRVKLTRRRSASYSISLSSDADERLHYASKMVDGFEIVSSDRTSTSNVTWSITKN